MGNLLGNKRIQGQAEPVEGLVVLKWNPETEINNIIFNTVVMTVATVCPLISSTFFFI